MLIVAPVLVMLGALAPWGPDKALVACVAPSHPCYALLIVCVVFGVIWASSSVMSESPLLAVDEPSPTVAFPWMPLLRAGFAILLLVMLFWYIGLAVAGKSMPQLEPGVIVLLPLLVLLIARVIRLMALVGERRDRRNE